MSTDHAAHARNIHLDMLRGLAILGVVGYHFYGRGPFAYGHFGVLLFFLISGYCIQLSEASSNNAWRFYAKRVARLLPALVACGMLTAAVKIFFPVLLAERPVDWIDPILVAVNMPTLDLLRIPYHYPDWAYWSLAVEFEYYALIAVLMLFVRGRTLVMLLVIGSIGVLALLLSKRWNHPPQLVYFLPFFVAGASLKLTFIDRKKHLGMLGIVTALVYHATCAHQGFVTSSLPASMFSLVAFLLSIILLAAIHRRGHESVANFRLVRALAFTGLISYPFYLLHQDIGNTFLHLVGADCVTPACVDADAPWRLGITPLLMGLLAWLVHRGVERPLIAPLTQMLVRLPAVLSFAMHSVRRHITGGRQ